MIACLHCGALHDERARLKMLRSGVWVPQKAQPTDEGSISFQLGRLDSARASLGAIAQEFRRASRGAERGDPRALATFLNTVLGLPGESGGADIDRLYERRGGPRGSGTSSLQVSTCIHRLTQQAPVQVP